MWTMIPSLQQVVDCLAPAFTQPSFATCGQLLLAWALCLGKHTLMRVGHSADPTEPPDLSRRHGLDTYYSAGWMKSPITGTGCENKTDPFRGLSDVLGVGHHRAEEDREVAARRARQANLASPEFDFCPFWAAQAAGARAWSSRRR